MHASDPTDHSTTDAQRALREEIKDLIVTTLRLENVNPRDIGDTELLFSPDARLGLDSLARSRCLRRSSSPTRSGFPTMVRADYFESVSTLAAFVASARS